MIICRGYKLIRGSVIIKMSVVKCYYCKYNFEEA